MVQKSGATRKSRSSAPKAKTPAAPAAKEEEAVNAASSTEAKQAEQPTVTEEKPSTEDAQTVGVSEEQPSGDGKDGDGENQPSPTDAGNAAADEDDASEEEHQGLAGGKTGESGFADGPDIDDGKSQIEVKTRRGLSTFRRAGLRFGPKARTLVLDDLSFEQIEAICNEPNLVVEEV